MQRDSSKDRHEPLNGFGVIVGEETAFALVRCLNRCGNNHGDTAPPPMPERPGSQPTPEESGGTGKNASSFLTYIIAAAPQGAAERPMRTVPAAVTGLLKRRSIHNRNIQPELLRAEPRADIFGGADDRSSQPAANAAGFRHRFAISAANDRTGKERIACAGGIDHVYLLRYMPRFPT